MEPLVPPAIRYEDFRQQVNFHSMLLFKLQVSARASAALPLSHGAIQAALVGHEACAGVARPGSEGGRRFGGFGYCYFWYRWRDHYQHERFRQWDDKLMQRPLSVPLAMCDHSRTALGTGCPRWSAHSDKASGEESHSNSL
jgi:hypothetical protein